MQPGGRALNVEWRRLDVLTAINLRMPGNVDSGVSVWVLTSIRERKIIQIIS